MKVNFLIVGQGLAGSLLAWQLLRRNQRVLVVDRAEDVSSSKIAAGLVTPLAGSRFNIPNELEERLSYAHQFYWELEEKTKGTYFHHRRIARLFRSEEEAQTWKQRLDQNTDAFEKLTALLDELPESVSAPWGGFEMKGGGWLDLPAFLEATRQHLLERLSYAIGNFNSEDIELREDGLRWKNVEADAVIFAEGWRGNQNHFFDWIPMKPAAGDILDLEISELEEEKRILNSGGWILPLGDGRFRAGSTYRHDLDDPYGHDEGRDEVLKKANSITSAEIKVARHRSAIRPIIRRSQIFMGRHPSHPQVVFFNGLGSKGVLNGPWHSHLLVEHLMNDTALPEENDIRSNFI